MNEVLNLRADKQIYTRSCCDFTLVGEVDKILPHKTYLQTKRFSLRIPVCWEAADKKQNIGVEGKK